MNETMEQLNKMQELGFKLFGETFAETLTYHKIQSKKKKLHDKMKERTSGDYDLR